MADGRTRLRAWTTDAVAAAVIAFMSTTYALSYAALLFAGTSPGTQARGRVMMLTACLVLLPVGALLSTISCSMLVADGTLIAMLATVAVGIVADLHGAPEPAVFATLTVMLMLATVATGGVLWLVGRLRLGGLVRFLPFQVMAGVLAASGWSLVVGGMAVALGHPFTLASLQDGTLQDGGGLAHPLATLAMGVGLMLLLGWFRHPATLPLAIGAALLLHHGIAALLGWPLAAQRAGGWLLELPVRLSVDLPWSPDIVASVRWGVLRDHAAGLLALVPVTAICVLLNVTGVETALGRDVDLNRDLKANGWANLLCGLCGGVLGITSVSRSLLAYNLGVRGWLAGAFAGFAAGLLPLLWPELLGLIPRSMLGGLLVFSGLNALRLWAVRQRRLMTWSEWLTVLAVLAITAYFGLVVGALAGLLLGCITFAAIYAHASPIRARYRGDVARSHVDRSDAEQTALAAAADTLLVLHLQGFVFFGTTSRLVDEVRTEAAAVPGMRTLVLDFHSVNGIDVSAQASFERLHRLVAAARIDLVLCGMAPAVAARLAPLARIAAQVTQTMDEALEWHEDAVLAAAGPAAPLTQGAILPTDFDEPSDVDAFFAMLTAQEVGPGTVLMRQGEMSDDLLFIEHGRASITVRFNQGPPMRVRSAGAGTMVGEIGFCLGLARTATVTADGPSRVLWLSRASMERLERERPQVALAFQRLVMRRMAERLLDKDRLIAALVLEKG